MGPYCKYCGQRCFVRITAEWPTHIAQAYAPYEIAATCADGQAVEKRVLGWCYADARAQMDPMFSAARLVLQKILRERGELEKILAREGYTAEELVVANRIIRGATMNLLGALEELVGEIQGASTNPHHQHSEAG